MKFGFVPYYILYNILYIIYVENGKLPAKKEPYKLGKTIDTYVNSFIFRYVSSI